MKRILFLCLYCSLFAAHAQELSFYALSPQKQVVQSLAYSPNGQLLASTVQDDVHVWSLQNKNSTILKGNVGPANDLAFAKDNLHLLAAYDGGVALWDIAQGTVKHTFKMPNGKATAVTYSPDNAYVAAGSTSGEVHVWHVSSGSSYTLFNGHQQEVTDLVFSLDGNFLVSASADKTILVWDFKNKNLHKTLAAHKGWVKKLAVSPDSLSLASAGYDKKIFLWNIPAKAETAYTAKIKHPHNNWISGLDFSPENFLVSVGHDDRIALYNINNQDGIFRKSFFGEKMFDFVEQQPNAVQLNPASFQVAVATLGRGVYVDDYFQTKFKPGHDFKILTVNGLAGKPDKFVSMHDTATILSSISRPTEVKKISFINEATKEKEYQLVTSQEFTFSLNLPNRKNSFLVIIEDVDPKIPGHNIP